MDFTIVASNRYIKSYFWDNRNNHLILDRLNSRIRPMEILFPLESEGKIVIRDKVREEINILIKELGIDGEIEDVYIHNIIGA